ncbi:ATP-binding cassette domain-containing protein [Saccharibacillus deserti]|uniref:ATP-binding cassette domain-containing protein n=1 Tax=Saccharibacillus deserti TaxID=1634444 RepID=UPI001557759D|nr:ATP-binding cassette domain-containing protein [Saccharibacillus deserti]
MRGWIKRRAAGKRNSGKRLDGRNPVGGPPESVPCPQIAAGRSETVIELTDADYIYQAGSPFAAAALYGVNIRIRRGTLVGIAGGTGSGKSTLLQLLNGLLLPAGGSVRVLDHMLVPGLQKPKLNALRRRVGLSFQFPEQHLFEDTVEKDLMFGPLNFGMTREQAQAQALEALHAMKLDDSLLKRHPLTLSGGQMRKAAIASVLAAGPEVLMLDEPTATLDSAARRELVLLLARLCREEGRTILVVTHRIEELLEVADEWIVMHEGRAVFQGDADELGDRADELDQWGVAVPEPLKCWAEWTARLPQLAALPLPRTAQEMARRIAEAVHQSANRSALEAEAGNPGGLEASVCATN